MLLLASLLLAFATLSFSSPVEIRSVAALNTAAFEEAQKQDTTATKAFSVTEIKTSTGQCLFVDELSGDFRANLSPIQVANCNGSAGQLWDAVTAGKHNDQKGTMLIVNTLTGACMNFDPRRAAGNTVIMFSCGGRADGGGDVTPSQLFPLANTTNFSFAPINAVETCLAVTSKNVLDQAPCKDGDATQSFSFGGNNASSSPVANPVSTTESSTSATTTDSTDNAPNSLTGCTSITVITITRPRSTSLATNTPLVETLPIESTRTNLDTTITIPATTTTSTNVIASSNPTAPISVSRAGGIFNPSAVAESQQRDDTAVRAFSSVSLKSSTNLCLTVSATTGDFRQNLIPITLSACSNDPGQKFDFITSGLHTGAPGLFPNTTLIVSTLTSGCLNFDPRRAAGDTVTLFSCGGRADGQGTVVDSQLFQFANNGTGTGERSLRLQPENGKGEVCLVGNAEGRLDQGPCDSETREVFSIV